MRSIWEGSISFGLINIPVRLYTASKEKKLAFHFLQKNTLCPIKYVKVCENTGKQVPNEEIAHGFEYEKGQFIILDKDDFEKANVKKTHSIEVFQFTDIKEIDEILFEKPYYLEPVKGADHAYVLFREALKKSSKKGIAKFVLKNREKLAALSVKDNLIILNQIRYADEIISPVELKIPSQEIQKKELDMAIKLVDQLSEPFDHEKYHDTYSEDLEKIIQQKLKGIKPKAKGQIPVPVTEMEDIMTKLKESLQQSQKRK